MAPSIRGITRQVNENGVTEQKAESCMRMIESYKRHSMGIETSSSSSEDSDEEVKKGAENQEYGQIDEEES